LIHLLLGYKGSLPLFPVEGSLIDHFGKGLPDGDTANLVGLAQTSLGRDGIVRFKFSLLNLLMEDGHELSIEWGRIVVF
jgi:hypothetical protein